MTPNDFLENVPLDAIRSIPLWLNSTRHKFARETVEVRLSRPEKNEQR
jgi:hypothetical protein